MIETILSKRLSLLHGKRASAEQVEQLKNSFGDTLPSWLLTLLVSYPLAGCTFIISEDEDESELGVEMQWLSASQMLSESFDTHPGIVAVPKGYLPIGSCLLGSGDYYYISNKEGQDPPLLRIPHEASDGETLIESEIEKVSSSLSKFLSAADIE